MRGEDPKLHLFGQLKRVAKQWLDGYLVCKGGTYPAQLKYKMLADMACNRITAAITRQFLGDRPIKALLDPYNTPAARGTFVSTRLGGTAGKRTGLRPRTTSTGSCSTAIGRRSSAA
jgi:hypothetical protein